VAQLALFAAELVAWGDESTAAGWLDVVERVSVAERALFDTPAGDGVSATVDPDDGTAAGGALTATVAAALFKLTAYKDEYEVARLMTDPEATAVLDTVRRPGDRVAWKLHPPMLEALGLDRKITVGAWAEPGVRLLAKGKRLRGTPADPFGRTEMRRLERELPGEYVRAIDRMLAVLSAENVDRAVTLAGLPDQVRGYEQLKLRRIGEYRSALTEALAGLGA
jgi:indolepyruvate ferredoxin oxidoreductase